MFSRSPMSLLREAGHGPRVPSRLCCSLAVVGADAAFLGASASSGQEQGWAGPPTTHSGSPHDCFLGWVWETVLSPSRRPGYGRDTVTPVSWNPAEFREWSCWESGCSSWLPSAGGQEEDTGDVQTFCSPALPPGASLAVSRIPESLGALTWPDHHCGSER